MRSLYLRPVHAVAVAIVAMGCANEAPGQPSPQPISSLTLRAIVFDAPALMIVGDPTINLQARAELSDGSVVEISKIKCTPVWTSSASAYATVQGGVLEATAIGDATIGVACNDVRAEKTVRVRRRLTGTVLASDNNQPITGALVTIASGPDSGVEARTDGTGRFTMPVPSTVELQAAAPEFDTVTLRNEETQGTVQLTMTPSIFTDRWEGWFVSSESFNRYPQGVLPGFEFETHHTADITLTLLATCATSGTYDDFSVWLDQDGRSIFGISPTRASTAARKAVRLPPGRYVVNLNRGNVYARSGCTWQLELSRPY